MNYNEFLFLADFAARKKLHFFFRLVTQMFEMNVCDFND